MTETPPYYGPDWYPEANRIPLPETAYWPRANEPIAVVHHIAEGYWSTLTDPGFWSSRGSSVHFAVSKAGEVAQLVPLSGAAWGNGLVQNPSWPLLTPENPNKYTVSIEHEGFTGQPWPAEQVAATIRLTAWILDGIGAVAGVDTVIGHYRIDSVDRRNCPGSGWPVTDILEQLGAGLDDESAAAVRRIAYGVALARMNGHVRTRHKSIATTLSTHGQRLSALEKRVRVLEAAKR